MKVTKKRQLILIAQIGIVVLSAIAIYLFVNNQISPKTAYTYAKNLESNTTIKESDIKEVSIPGQALNPHFATSKKDILNKKLIDNVVEGEYVYKGQIADEDKGSVLAGLDKSKSRKITIDLKDQAKPGKLEEGSSVDLIYVGKGHEKDTNQEFIYSKTFLQNIPVVGILREDTGNKDVEGEISGITLAVTLPQAEEIQTRLSVGSVKILDRYNESEPYETMGYVVGDYSKVFTGEASAETGKTPIAEDGYAQNVESNGFSKSSMDFSSTDLQNNKQNANSDIQPQPIGKGAGNR